MRFSAATIAVVLAGLAFSVAGCGVRGSLEYPAESKTDTASAESGQGKKEGEAPKPHRGFVLDGLIR
jgi:predicted small lipoprotein YifL